MANVIRSIFAFCLQILILGTATSGFAQVDPTKALIGRWEGQVESSSAPGGNQRTLMISSVKAQGEGEWIARGRFGFTGQVQEGPGGQEISVSSKNNEIFIEFATGTGKAPVRLKLVDDNTLKGTIGGFDRGRAVNYRISLEKIKAGDIK
jgi:hypothetical protein